MAKALRFGVVACALGLGGCGAPAAVVGPEPKTAATAPAKVDEPLDGRAPTGEGKQRLKAALALVDGGKPGEGARILEELARDYPDNAVVVHELGLAYRMGKKPDKAVALWLPLRAKLPVQTLAGLASALDEAGRSDEAIALLREELDRHPKEGILHSELATTLARGGHLDEAVKLYQRGTEVEPGFPANYVHLADIFATTRSRGLGLLYGETFRVLEPSSARSEHIAKLLVQICGEAVTIDRSGGKTNAKVSLAPDYVLHGPDDKFPLVNVFELAYGPGLVLAHLDKASLAALHQAKRSFLDFVKANPGPTADLAKMPIVLWLADLDAAGHLEAYDHWLYGPAFPDELAAYAHAHENEITAFSHYFDEHPLVATGQ